MALNDGDGRWICLESHEDAEKTCSAENKMSPTSGGATLCGGGPWPF